MDTIVQSIPFVLLMAFVGVILGMCIRNGKDIRRIERKLDAIRELLEKKDV